MKKSISVVFALSFLISFPVSALEEPYQRRCSIWINGSRVHVLSCIGSRDERGRVNHIEWDNQPYYMIHFDGGYVSRHPRHKNTGGPFAPGQTKDCFVNVNTPHKTPGFNYAICLYD